VAHPFENFRQNKTSKRRAQKLTKGYESGGGVTPIRIEPAPLGSIERQGMNTYRRELGRESGSGRFGVNPYTRKE